MVMDTKIDEPAAKAPRSADWEEWLQGTAKHYGFVTSDDVTDRLLSFGETIVEAITDEILVGEILPLIEKLQDRIAELERTIAELKEQKKFWWQR
jgi:hypothetical protein